MAKTTTRVIVFYDISDDRRRQRMARTLEALGLTRIQRSVYIGRGGQAKAKEAIRAAQRIIEKTDSVVAVVVPEDYARRLLVAGTTMNQGSEHRRAGRAVRIV